MTMVNKLFLLLIIVAIASCKFHDYSQLHCDCSSNQSLKNCLAMNLHGREKSNFSNEFYFHHIAMDSVKVRYRFYPEDVYDTIPKEFGMKRIYTFDFDIASGNCILNSEIMVRKLRNRLYRNKSIFIGDSTTTITNFKSIAKSKDLRLINDLNNVTSYMERGSYIFIDVEPKNWNEINKTDKTKKTLLSITIEKKTGKIVGAYRWKASNYSYERSSF